jgi:hypothetical protein
MKRAFLAIAASVIPLCSQAQTPTPVTGMEIYNWCMSKVTAIETGCWTFLAGVTEGIVLGQQLLKYNTAICLPTGITPPQMQLMVQNAAREHPELLNQPSVAIVGRRSSMRIAAARAKLRFTARSQIRHCCGTELRIHLTFVPALF